MSTLEKVTLSNGAVWGVAGWVLTNAEVIVPVDALDGMSDAEIGKAVRSLVPQARLMQASDEAANVLAYKTGDSLSRSQAVELLSQFESRIDRWEPFTELDIEVQQAREFLVLLRDQVRAGARRVVLT